MYTGNFLERKAIFMVKVNETVKRETVYIAGWVVLLSVVMEIIFLVIGKWNITVLLGNLLSGGAIVLNFFLMGITVQKAVEKDEKAAKNTIKTSQSLRTVMMFCFAALGVLLPCFNTWTSLIPFFFPRIAIALRPLFDKKVSGGGTK